MNRRELFAAAVAPAAICAGVEERALHLIEDRVFSFPLAKVVIRENVPPEWGYTLIMEPIVRFETDDQPHISVGYISEKNAGYEAAKKFYDSCCEWDRRRARSARRLTAT